MVSRLRSDNTQSAPELRRDSTASIALPDLSLTGRAASDRLQDPPLHYQFYGGSGRPPSSAAMAGLESVFNTSVEDSEPESPTPKQDLISFVDDEAQEEALVDLTVGAAVATHKTSMWDAQPSVSRWFDLPEDSADGRSTLTPSRREEPSAASRTHARQPEHDSVSELILTPSRTKTPAAATSAEELSSSLKTRVDPLSGSTSLSRQPPRAALQAIRDTSETAEGLSATAQVAVSQTAETLASHLMWIQVQELDLD